MFYTLASQRTNKASKTAKGIKKAISNFFWFGDIFIVILRLGLLKLLKEKLKVSIADLKPKATTKLLHYIILKL